MGAHLKFNVNLTSKNNHHRANDTQFQACVSDRVRFSFDIGQNTNQIEYCVRYLNSANREILRRIFRSCWKRYTQHVRQFQSTLAHISHIYIVNTQCLRVLPIQMNFHENSSHFTHSLQCIYIKIDRMRNHFGGNRVRESVLLRIKIRTHGMAGHKYISKGLCIHIYIEMKMRQTANSCHPFRIISIRFNSCLAITQFKFYCVLQSTHILSKYEMSTHTFYTRFHAGRVLFLLVFFFFFCFIYTNLSLSLSF